MWYDVICWKDKRDFFEIGIVTNRRWSLQTRGQHQPVRGNVTILVKNLITIQTKPNSKKTILREIAVLFHFLLSKKYFSFPSEKKNSPTTTIIEKRKFFLFLWPLTPSPLHYAACHSCPVVANITFHLRLPNDIIGKLIKSVIVLFFANSRGIKIWKVHFIFNFFLFIFLWNIIWIADGSDIVVSSLATHLKVETLFYLRFFFYLSFWLSGLFSLIIHLRLVTMSLLFFIISPTSVLFSLNTFIVSC